MSGPKPSELAFVPFVSVENMMRLVHRIGVEPMLRDLADYIEADFRRWERFDKTPRVASHSAEGVIELMPTSDGEVYGFKYVNGHPKNTRSGRQTVTAFGVLARVDTGYPVLLSEMTILTALRTAASLYQVAFRSTTRPMASPVLMTGMSSMRVGTMPSSTIVARARSIAIAARSSWRGRVPVTCRRRWLVASTRRFGSRASMSGCRSRIFVRSSGAAVVRRVNEAG